jgi:P27 family predicted phage terminase small subunit
MRNPQPLAFKAQSGETKLEAPRDLSREAAARWRELAAEYSIEDSGGRAILLVHCEAYDTAQAAAAILKKEGMTAVDRFGQPRAHPAAVILRDARSQMLTALRQLNLDVIPAREHAGRPAGGRYVSTIRRRSRQSQPPEVSPASRWYLALGTYPNLPRGAELPGELEAFQDSRPVLHGPSLLEARDGDAVRAECERAGFQPAFLVPLSEQSEEAQAAARTWRAALLALYQPEAR